MHKISIYQVFTRLFGNTKNQVVENGSLAQNGVGKFNDFTHKALQSIKDLGITHIWYTGIIEHASCENYPDYGIVSQHPAVVKGRAGSPYAIIDYYDVNPYLAQSIPDRMQEFEKLVERSHHNELKVIIDFVPNHVARQYGSDIYPEKDFGLNDDTSKAFSPQNDFYYIPNEPLHMADDMGTFFAGRSSLPYTEIPARATGNDQFHAYPTLNDWYETVKLNYGVDYTHNKQTHFSQVPPLWDKMVAILEFWCAKDIDGIRCDMAEMVPVEFWEYAIGKIKAQYPEIIFIAEVYNPHEYASYLHRGGFDYLYDKVGLYDCLRGIICDEKPAYEITQCWQNLGGIDAKMLRFLENHDEHRIAAAQFAGNAKDALPAMVVSATLNTGPVMLYFGQELGEAAKGAAGYSGDDGKTTIFDFYHVPEHQKWYNKGAFNEALLNADQVALRTKYRDLLNFCIHSPAIAQGSFYDVMWVNQFDGGPDTRFVYAYLRYHENEKLLVVVNFSKKENQHFKLKIPQDAFSLMGYAPEQLIAFEDVFSNGASMQLPVTQIIHEGIAMEMTPLKYLIFRIS